MKSVNMTKREIELWGILSDKINKEKQQIELDRGNRDPKSSKERDAGYQCAFKNKPLPRNASQAFIDGFNSRKLGEEQRLLTDKAEAMIKYVGDSSYYIIHHAVTLIVYKKYSEFRGLLADSIAAQELIGEIISYMQEGHPMGIATNKIYQDSNNLANRVRIYTEMLGPRSSGVKQMASKRAKKVVREFKEFISSGIRKEQSRWIKAAKVRAITIARRIVEIEREASKSRYLCDAFHVDLGISAEKYWIGNVTSPDDDIDSIFVPKNNYRIGKLEAVNITTFMDTIPYTRDEINDHYIRLYCELREYEHEGVIGYSYDSFKTYLAIRRIYSKRLISILNAALKKERARKI